MIIVVGIKINTFAIFIFARIWIDYLFQCFCLTCLIAIRCVLLKTSYFCLVTLCEYTFPCTNIIIPFNCHSITIILTSRRCTCFISIFKCLITNWRIYFTFSCIYTCVCFILWIWSKLLSNPSIWYSIITFTFWKSTS